MRKSKSEAAKTRLRIVETAAKEFRENGIEKTGIAELMNAAGLTVGGFYRHFESKDQLVAEACDHVSQSVLDLRKKTVEINGLKKIIDTYLSDQHRADKANGCLFAALGSELARMDGDARTVATENIVQSIDLLTQEYRRADHTNARGRALVTLSILVGALTLSRITEDSQVSDAFLRHGRAHLTAFAEHRV